MPEGDTIHTIANAMRPELEGELVTHVFARVSGRLRALEGARVERVWAIGKHLLIGIADRAVMRVHLGMDGSWHRYRIGEPWKRSAETLSARIDTKARCFVCFEASEAEVIKATHLNTHPALSRLGQDLLAPEIDWDALDACVLERSRRHRLVADLLLDQTAACGIGNVYKCELLFLHRLPPDALCAGLPIETFQGLYRDARRLMQPNVDRVPRVTTALDRPLRSGEPATFVYGRRGEHCSQCRTPIEFLAGHGDFERVIYWCPTCQAEHQSDCQ